MGRAGERAELVDEDHQAGDRDDVVEHRCPHVRTEGALGVEHLTDHRVEAVEEDLRERDQANVMAMVSWPSDQPGPITRMIGMAHRTTTAVTPNSASTARVMSREM